MTTVKEVFTAVHTVIKDKRVARILAWETLFETYDQTNFNPNSVKEDEIGEQNLKIAELIADFENCCNIKLKPSSFTKYKFLDWVRDVEKLIQIDHPAFFNTIPKYLHVCFYVNFLLQELEFPDLFLAFRIELLHTVRAIFNTHPEFEEYFEQYISLITEYYFLKFK